MDAEHCYRVASSRDGRFDGTFVTAVLTTRIYCRPSCPAVTPKRENVRFYPTPAAAQDAGFRACKRCRPDASPGSPDWDSRADVVARAVRLIGDGVVEREGIAGLSKRLGYGPRQVHRLVSAELGTGPLRLAMAHRVQNARALLENTDLSVTDIAWASGFHSIRQFNDQIRHVYALTPSEVRARRTGGHPGAAATRGHSVVAHLSYRPPLDLSGLLEFLGRRAVPGVESWDGQTYTRALDLPFGPGVAQVQAHPAGRPRSGSHPTIPCLLHLGDIRDYAAAVSRMRRLLDLDADPQAVALTFGDDPVLGPLVSVSPGRRVPGAVSPFEMAVRAVVGQQVSVSSSGVACGRLAARLGRPLDRATFDAQQTAVGRTFPGPDDLADADPADLRMPASRAATVVALARAVADGRIRLDAGADRDETERRLLELPGIGPWTAAYIRMRALGDPDVFLPGDLVLERAKTGPGADPATGPEAWKPWRSYAVVHLWAAAHTSTGPQAAAGEGTAPGTASTGLATPRRRRPAGPGATTPRRNRPPAQPTPEKGTHMNTTTAISCWDEVVLDFPAGPMPVVLAGDSQALVGLRFGTGADHAAWLGSAPRDPSDPVLREAARQLRDYASGQAETFDVPVRIHGSEFQMAVWNSLREIPYGATTTYGALAARLGRSGRAARAVGAAVGANPVGIIIPCHRVVGSDGSLTGFAGGLDHKIALLAREGVAAL